MNQPTLYEVTSINKVDTTQYKEGDFFKTKQSLGVLHNGKIKTLNFSKPLKISDVTESKELHDVVTEIFNTLYNETTEEGETNE